MLHSKLIKKEDVFELFDFLSDDYEKLGGSKEITFM